MAEWASFPIAGCWHGRWPESEKKRARCPEAAHQGKGSGFRQLWSSETNSRHLRAAWENNCLQGLEFGLMRPWTLTDILLGPRFLTRSPCCCPPPPWEATDLRQRLCSSLPHSGLWCRHSLGARARPALSRARLALAPLHYELEGRTKLWGFAR